jgi:hypothetical protein
VITADPEIDDVNTLIRALLTLSLANAGEQTLSVLVVLYPGQPRFAKDVR